MKYAWNDKRDCIISIIIYFIEEPVGYFNIQISWIFSSNNVRLIFVQAVPLTADITVKLLPYIMEWFFKHCQKEVLIVSNFILAACISISDAIHFLKYKILIIKFHTILLSSIFAHFIF